MNEAVVIGLMSGTSLDGISAAAVRFRKDGESIDSQLLGFSVRQYDQEQRARLLNALQGVSPSEYCRLNADLGSWLADAAIAVLAEAGVARSDVAAIASHGQTVWHEPGHSTWQFGEAAVIAERTGLPVISDFRVRDVAAGGQGAPLVPIADALLFAARDKWRALQNIGGIGNVSVVPPGGGIDGTRAFDTGPGVAVIDGIVRVLYRDMAFDVDGRIAATGKSVPGVVDTLLADPWFATSPPKSTGRELFSAAYINRFIELCREARPGCREEDIVATAVSFTARSIADAYRRFVAEPVADVLVSGGGARNQELMKCLERALAPRTVKSFTDVFFDGEAKEAVAFALMGWLHQRGEPGNVPSATGASRPRVLGKLTPA
jgi:anhydro-N-acetylmuramic acid kinase